MGAKHVQNTKHIKIANEEVKEKKNNYKCVTGKQNIEQMEGQQSDNFKSENIEYATDSKQKLSRSTINGTKYEDESDDRNCETALQNIASISQYAKPLKIQINKNIRK